jgi:F0F1-type ATP synthase assembly protein I
VDDPTHQALARIATIGAVGTEMVTPIGLGLLADHFFGTMPILTIVGALIGFGVGIYHLIVLNRPKQP